MLVRYLVLALACLSVIVSCSSAYAVSFNCVPYFRTGPPSPPIISNVTQIPNATEEEWWVVHCKAIPVTVSTDKLSYESGDTIVASGTATNIPAGIVMGIKVVAPNGNIVTVGQAPVGTDGTFSLKIVTGGSLWKQAGMYALDAEEVNTQRSASTEFYFSGPPSAPFSSSIMVQNSTIMVPYTIINGKMISISVDPYLRSLLISLHASGRGALTVDLPRTLIDSKGANQTDLNFVVTTDGLVPHFDETRNATSRDLIIPFEGNTTQIRIIGTQVIPEFGPVALAFLAVAIIGLIGLAHRTKLRYQI
ncbi:MAG: copper-binding protein [Thaumarchaeota archaeon]|nr:copper-binding protein [Nitrososphaerota archaeon]